MEFSFSFFKYNDKGGIVMSLFLVQNHEAGTHEDQYRVERV
jgi:hypothetical protein